MDTDPSPALFFCTELLYLTTYSMTVSLAVVSLVVLLFCSALMSGSEIAFFSLDARDLDQLRSERSRTASRILQLRASSRRLLATILIANNLVNIAIIILAAYLTTLILPASLFIPWADRFTSYAWFRSVSITGLAEAISFILMIIIVTFLLVLFGEITPRVYSKVNNMRVARLMAHPLQILVAVFSPISDTLVKWSRWIEKKLQRMGNGNSTDALIKDDIDKAIDLAMPQDASSQLEAGILKSIIKFNDVPVKQIMRSRMDVIALDDEVPFTRLKEIVRTEGYSRMPVYHENLDNILGILYVKDLIGHMEEGDGFVWQELIRTQLLYVPESKKINELLKEFQSSHVHLGIVVDEYGGTAGIVTLEDVMEEVLGEIKDEFDEPVEGDYRKIDQHTYLFDGKVLLNDVCRIINVDIHEFDDLRGDADSLAGLILELSGKMPERGQEFGAAGILFTVISVSTRRIEKIRVRLRSNEA